MALKSKQAANGRVYLTDQQGHRAGSVGGAGANGPGTVQLAPIPQTHTAVAEPALSIAALHAVLGAAEMVPVTPFDELRLTNPEEYREILAREIEDSPGYWYESEGQSAINRELEALGEPDLEWRIQFSDDLDDVGRVVLDDGVMRVPEDLQVMWALEGKPRQLILVDNWSSESKASCVVSAGRFSKTFTNQELSESDVVILTQRRKEIEDRLTVKKESSFATYTTEVAALERCRAESLHSR